MECKNSFEIKNKELFMDYQSRLPRNVTYYILAPTGGGFLSGYVCKKAIKEVCNELEEK